MDSDVNSTTVSSSYGLDSSDTDTEDSMDLCAELFFYFVIMNYLSETNDTHHTVH